ncbi:hypothetical protein INN71_16835 [Nocardioides sp. ChNu-153]|uniref:DUF6892 domain-containing protein n=1 Tax=Nocardioides sp. ChNu-153 TaxID=2779364 RepID=UPI002656D89C|nr:hypothetical protein [Nocardioides sp. ChNu-153]MDN7123052.1 hypothetical protein [Nocardioides sp. ChNu-153]
MHDGRVVAPHPSAHAWLQASRGIEWDAAEGLIYGEYAYQRIPEIEQWARDLVLDEADVASVRRLVFDGGNAIFGLMAPSWDGEDDLFDPTTWADVTPERFPLLELVVYVEPFEDHVRRSLEGAGVELRHL